jgi:uncharacterized protein (DUF4415 family)
MSKRRVLTNKAGRVRELTRKDMRAMRPASEVLPPEVLNMLPKRKRGERGAQIKPRKISVTVRYSPEVVEYFKTMGEGWQRRMDEVLRQWVKKHPKKVA